MAAGHIVPGTLGPAPASAKRAVRFLAGSLVWHRLIRCGRLLGVYQYPRARQRVRSVSGFDDGCICGLYCPGVQPAVFDLWPLVQPSTAGLGGGFPFTLAIGGMAALLAAHGLPLVVPGLRPPRFLAGGLGANTGGYGSRPHRGTQRGAGWPLARTMACQHPPPAPPLGSDRIYPGTLARRAGVQAGLLDRAQHLPHQCGDGAAKHSSRTQMAARVYAADPGSAHGHERRLMAPRLAHLAGSRYSPGVPPHAAVSGSDSPPGNADQYGVDQWHHLRRPPPAPILQ